MGGERGRFRDRFSAGAKVSALVLSAAFGCTAKTTSEFTIRASTGPALPQQQAFELPAIEVNGTARRPELLVLATMPTLAARVPTTLERQRRKVARKNPASPDVQLLAALLWDTAHRVPAGDSGRVKLLRGEARELLAEDRQARGKDVSAQTLHMAAVAEEWANNLSGAMALYEDLLTRFPKREATGDVRVALAVLYLRANRPADAHRLLKDRALDSLSPYGAYVAGWAAFASGADWPRARTAIKEAFSAWPDRATRKTVGRELATILAQTDTEATLALGLVEDAVADLQPPNDERKYKVWYRLSEAYQKAGHFAEATAVIDALLAREHAFVVDESNQRHDRMPSYRVLLRFQQADDAFRDGLPTEAAAHAIAAHRAIAECDAECRSEHQTPVTERLLKLAQVSHTVYVNSFDPRHLQAAEQLYRYYLAIPGAPEKESARTFQQRLERARKSADPSAGKHEADVMHNMVLARREAIASCYERELLHEPTLDGRLVLQIEVDETGAVTDATSPIAEGDDAMAKVARCAASRVKTWHFPSRTVAGTTTLTVPFELRLAAPSTARSSPSTAP